jgi:hypothetical protein
MLMGEFNTKPLYNSTKITSNTTLDKKPQIPFIVPYVYWLSENRGSPVNMASLYVCQPYVMEPIGVYNSFKAIKYNVAEDSPPTIKIRLINTVRKDGYTYNLKGGKINVLTDVFKVAINTYAYDDNGNLTEKGTSSAFSPSTDLQQHNVSNTDTILYKGYGDQNKTVAWDYSNWRKI